MPHVCEQPRHEWQVEHEDLRVPENFIDKEADADQRKRQQQAGIEEGFDGEVN